MISERREYDSLVVSGEKLLCRDATEGYVMRIYALDDLMQTGARGA